MGAATTPSTTSRKYIAAQAITIFFTQGVNGGKLSESVRPRFMRSRLQEQAQHIIAAAYRSGTDTIGALLCPASSTAWTAKITLSFDTGTVAFKSLPTR